MIKSIGKVAIIAVGVAAGMILHDIAQPYVEDLICGDIDMDDLFNEVDDDEEEPEEEKAPIDYDVVSEEKSEEEAPAAVEEPEAEETAEEEKEEK